QQGRPDGLRRTTQHGFQQCPVIGYDEYVTWKRKVQLSDFGCCWRCGLPQRLCDGWAGEECADIDKVMPVLMLVGEDEGLKRVVRGKGQCASCVRYERTNAKHELFRCGDSRGKQTKEEYTTLKEGIRARKTMAVFSGCMKCFLPQSWCQAWEKRKNRWGYQR